MTPAGRRILIVALALVVALVGGIVIGRVVGGGSSAAGPSPATPTSAAPPSASTGTSPATSNPASSAASLSNSTSDSTADPTADSTKRTKRSRTSSAESTPPPAPQGLPDLAPVSCPATTVPVKDAATLTAALKAAQPGAVIGLADGTYTGQFVAATSGTQDRPIWLCGGPKAVLNGGPVKIGYAMHLNGAQWWRLVGFTIHGGQKGVVVDNGSHAVVQGLTVSGVGDEAIHLRAATTFSLVRDNTVSDTGQQQKKYGEGIYIGSANSNWCTYSQCAPDASNNNAVVGNHISRTSAESIDIKEGTQNGLIQGNTFDGAGGLTGADSWVDVKGNGWKIVDNSGANSPVDGFQVHSVVNGWGMSNVFQNNTADVNGSGYGIHLAPIQNNTVYCDNKVSGAAGGLTNTTCV